MDRQFETWPLWSVAPVLTMTALLPWGAGTCCALAAIIVLGVPHGALDGEIARGVIGDRFGRAWFVVFSLPYLMLFALVLAAWQAAPLWTLAVFLAASVWHFGAEDAGPDDGLGVLVRGGLPIALPVLVHPLATMRVFAAVTQTPIGIVPAWLWVASVIWVALTLSWAVLALAHRRPRVLLAPAVLGCVFVVLPPLTAFAIYFVCIHAPAHTATLIRRRRAPRVRDRRSAWLLAMPVTILTLAIGLSLWPLYSGPIPERLLALTIQGLAALTLPHMLLDAWVDYLERLEGRGILQRVSCVQPSGSQI